MTTARRLWPRILASAAVTAAIILVGCADASEARPRRPAPRPLSPSLTDPDPWAARAHAAISRTRQLDTGSETAFTYSFLAGAIADRYGWSDPRVQTYLGKVRAQRHPDGGYGLPYAWDAFADGSTNPADTTYAITLSEHIGRVMLDGYLAGVVPRAEVEQLVAMLVAMPSSTVPGPGVCMSYSDARTDAAYCLPNIVASAGRFLQDAWNAGIQMTGQQSLIAGLAERNSASYFDGTGFWPYIEGQTSPQDWNHNAVNVEGELRMSPAAGRAALAAHMGVDPAAAPRWYDPLGQVVLLPFACEYSAALTDDFDRFLANPRVVAQWAAQAAYWSSRAYKHC